MRPDCYRWGLSIDSPHWIFYTSAEPIDRLSQLKGKRIAVGAVGARCSENSRAESLARTASRPQTATFLPIAGTDAVEALRDGKVDAYWIASRARISPAVQTMLRMPNVRLMSFARAEALTRIFPDLVRLTVPQGVFDIAANIPPNDISLISTTVRDLIRNDLHPQIVSLLLQTIIKEHGGRGILQRAGEFPTQTDPEYPMAASVTDFYKNGPSFLQRHLPLWLTGWDRGMRQLAIRTAAGRARSTGSSPSTEALAPRWPHSRAVRSGARETRCPRGSSWSRMSWLESVSEHSPPTV